MDSQKIGQKIKKKRLENGMTLVELGEKIGVGKSVIWKYEQGEIHNIPLERIMAISEVLNSSYLDLLATEEGPLERIRSMNLDEEQLLKVEEYATFLKYSPHAKTP